MCSVFSAMAIYLFCVNTVYCVRCRGMSGGIRVYVGTVHMLGREVHSKLGYSMQ